MLGYIFWPIEGMIVLLSRSKRRMGDVWAGTRVKLTQNEISWFKRIKVGAAIVILGYILLYVIVPISNGKTIIAEAGRDYLNRKNIQFVNNPQGINIQSSPQGIYGAVTFKLIDDDGRSIVLSFFYENDQWVFQKRGYIKQYAFGLFTYNY